MPGYESTTRSQIEDSISRWWPGGATAHRIADYLEREGATVRESRFVGAKLADVAQRVSYISDAVIGERLESVRAIGSAGSTPVDRGFDSARCNFDTTACRECAEWDPMPTVHGKLVSIPAALYPEPGDDDYKAWMRHIGDTWRAEHAQA